MQETIGRDSSSSPPSSWLDDTHAHTGKHFLLVLYPDGRLILTTPDILSKEDMDMIQAVFNDWVENSDSRPLMIGNCQVIMQTLRPTGAEVVRAIV